MLGTREFTGLQVMQIIGDRQVKIVPEVQANGGAGAGGGLVDALIGLLAQQQLGVPLSPTAAATPLATATDARSGSSDAA